MHRFIIITSIFLSVCAVNCTKKKVETSPAPNAPVDYRDQFTGNYSFYYHGVYWQASSGSSEHSQNYNGQIFTGNPGKILFSWNDGNYHEFAVNEAGKILMCDSVIIGSFSGTHFEFDYTDDTCSPGPLGESYNIHLEGDKQ